MMSAMSVEDRSAVRFARVGGAAIAYQAFGTGPAPVLIVPPFAQNIELAWERPEYQAFFGRLGRFASVVHFDKRGTGASDRTEHVPTVDERVEDAVAVMNAAGLDSAHVLGLSEGGPVAIALAATYPDRVRSLTLNGSGARIVGDETDEERADRRAMERIFADHWGTSDTVTLPVFGPSVARDPSYRAWEPRYERQSATPAAIVELLEMVEATDVRSLLGVVTAPVLVVHRTDDKVVPIGRGREVAELLPSARFVELPGDDHFAHVGEVDGWLDHFEAFVAGQVTSRAAGPAAPRQVVIRTMGGFRVEVDGEAVAAGAWGSRQARLVCKRLAMALDHPVRRDELTDLLWPDELDDAKRGARLSVVLSNIRRVLGGGLIADREAVRLDLDAVSLDLADLHAALASGDDEAVVAACAGPVLPEEAYEDWATAARQRVASAVTGARRRLAAEALTAGRFDEAFEHAHAMVDADRYDEAAHELLVRSLLSAGRHGEARAAAGRYRACMEDLGVEARDLLSPA
jgi:pimeloyl-ACP methyl ester carboxylesterase/DNA-binding SARP family transcriptional activator